LFCLNAGDIGATFAQIVPFILAGSLALAAAFIWHEHRARFPMIPLRLFKNIPFTASILAALFMMTAYGGVLLIFPLFFESVWMFSPEQAGSMLVAASAGIMIASVLAGGLVDRIGCRKPAIIATGLAVAGAVLSFLLLGTSIMVLPAVAGLFLFGAGSGGFYPPNISLVMKYAPKGDEGAVSGILMTMRMLGQAIGFALFGAVFGTFVKNASGGEFHGPGTVAPEALLPGFGAAFLLTVLLLVITLLIVFMAREVREDPADSPAAGG
jgi:MFS family permease